MRTVNSWAAMGLVVVLVGIAGSPAHAEGLSIVPPVEPLTSRYLPQTLAKAPLDVPRVHMAVRHAQVALPGPVTRVTGSHPSLKAWMWAGVVVGAFVVVILLTVPRD